MLNSPQFPMLNCHPRGRRIPRLLGWELSIGQIFPYLHSVIGGDI
jgi:hypothetical protein